ncbi:lipase family protein [Vibrio paucivorans]|uniref:Lipase n=1 Tax=Vibrio paucivorans TaxID=2829489 RepID=A0A9X3CG86_9VIBR|nr:lipase [Vibrio paucivorans]MCW8335299.1 lipase [Vibrio paucivorans]
MDSFNYCVQCNPEDKWLELEFRSERDEPIDGLIVTITSRITPSCTYTQTTRSGKVLFRNIAAGEWRASVSQASLLTEVEKYPSRDEQQGSPVKKRAITEHDAEDNKAKQYRYTTIGDFWDEAPQDEFLQEHHKGVDINASAEKAGFRLSHNQTYVFEIKALRSYMPMIVDTNDFNLVNSYTFALLSKLAYATDELSVDDGKSADTNGSIDTVITQLKERKVPTNCSDLAVKWVVKEIPYSQSLKYRYYADDAVGAEGYILSNDDIAIIGIRGTEPYFEDRNRTEDSQLLKIVKAASGILVQVVDKLGNIIRSPGMQDLIKTDLDSAQISPPEFGGTYVHRGFYQYTMAFRNAVGDKLKQHKNKNIYVCGHSLGGAGALLLSALIKDLYSPATLRLYTFGMPRTGTRSFVQRYRDILHYRHVNNHDLIPQIPMTWANTDITEGLELSDIFGSVVSLAKKMITDNDDDNYLHHGSLSQLITYSNSKQVLLSPRQTQVTMLDIAKMAKNDSVALVDSLVDASITDHGMEFYIPNLLTQLQALSTESLYSNYQGSIAYLSNSINNEQRRYLEIKNSLAKALGTPYSPVNQAYITRLKQELSVSEELLDNQHQVKQELTSIMNSPERLPLSLLLLSNQSLPKEIKEQLK